MPYEQIGQGLQNLGQSIAAAAETRAEPKQKMFWAQQAEDIKKRDDDRQFRQTLTRDILGEVMRQQEVERTRELERAKSLQSEIATKTGNLSEMMLKLGETPDPRITNIEKLARSTTDTGKLQSIYSVLDVVTADVFPKVAKTFAAINKSESLLSADKRDKADADRRIAEENAAAKEEKGKEYYRIGLAGEVLDEEQYGDEKKRLRAELAAIQEKREVDDDGKLTGRGRLIKEWTSLTNTTKYKSPDEAQEAVFGRFVDNYRNPQRRTELFKRIGGGAGTSFGDYKPEEMKAVLNEIKGTAPKSLADRIDAMLSQNPDEATMLNWIRTILELPKKK